MNKELKMIAELPAPILANTLLPAVPLSETYLMDCIEGMKHYPDKYFDLAVVDPPYGIGEDGGNGQARTKKTKTRNTNTQLRKSHNKKNWDSERPLLEYFLELYRVSKNQIIWGGNYFTETLPPSKGWIVWYKMQEGLTMSDCELAYSSFNKPTRVFNGHRILVWSESPIHPTQKPTKLYDWIFKNYAEEGQRILDTHLGSGSSRIAAHKNKLNFVGFEIDKEYFDKQEKRFANYVCQPRLF